jgi:hypothetical protein
MFQIIINWKNYLLVTGLFWRNDFIDISDKPEEIIQTFEEIERKW